MNHASRHREIVRRLDAAGFRQSKLSIGFWWRRDCGYFYRVHARPTEALKLVFVAEGVEDEVLTQVDAWIAASAKNAPSFEQLRLF